LRERASTAQRVAASGLVRGEARLVGAAGLLDTVTRRALADEGRELGATRRVLVAFDPTRQLERGWTLTLDHRGALVRSAAGLRPGQRITSRFFDGDRTSVVDAETASP